MTMTFREKDQRLEQQMIHLVLRNPSLFPRIRLVPEDFHFYELIWKNICEKAEKGENISFSGDFKFNPFDFTLAESSEYVSELWLEEICYKIRERKILRTVKQMDSLDKVKDEVDKEFIKTKIPTAQEAFSTVSDEYANIQTMIEGGQTFKFETGYRWFDENIVLRKQQLVTIAARPKIGKSTFALNLALRLAKKGQKGIYINLEMTDHEAMMRAVSCTQDKNISELLNFEEQNIYGIIGKHLEEYDKLTIFSPKGFSSAEVDKIAEYYDFIVIDQLQNLGDKREKGEALHYYLGKIVAALKQTARKTNTLIFLCAQINRGGAYKPTVEHLKDCGRIEEDSDTVLILHRPDPLRAETWLNLAISRSQSYGASKPYTLRGNVCQFVENH